MAQQQRDPQKQIQKTQGAKEKQFFWFFLGVLDGFSRKSNENEFSRKSNGGWIFLVIKRGLRVAEENRAFLGILSSGGHLQKKSASSCPSERSGWPF